MQPADAFDALGAAGPVDGRVFLVGGGSRSAAFRQILADLLGRPVLVPDLVESGRRRRLRAGRGDARTGVAPVEIAERGGSGPGDRAGAR